MKAWLAFWMDGKTRRSKTFSSKVLGFEEARLAAVAFLQSRKCMDASNFPGNDEDVSSPTSPIENPSEGSTGATSSPSFISQEIICQSSC